MTSSHDARATDAKAGAQPATEPKAGAQPADNAQAGAKLADNAKPGAKLADNAKPGAKLADNAQAGMQLPTDPKAGAEPADNAQTGAHVSEDANAGAEPSHGAKALGAGGEGARPQAQSPRGRSARATGAPSQGAQAPDARAIVDWILSEGVTFETPVLVESLAHRLLRLGLPLDRFSIALGLLNPSLLAAGFIWRPGQKMTFSQFGYDNRDSGLYERSPFKRAHDTGEWVHIDLANTPDEAYGVVPDLRKEGITHYYAIPMRYRPGVSTEEGWRIAGRMTMTLATKGAHDFSPEHLQLIADILPALAVAAEIRTLYSTFNEVLSAYVGREPAEQIVQGSIHRGEVTEVRAAILVADLRGFTHLSTQLPPEATADVINRYYDVVVPAIEARGGQVLKFIGDAVLATFPAARLGDAGAILAALDASRAALDTKVDPYVNGERRFPITFGIAVHFGEAVYGNVGSGDRLDFTVIGRDVNVAARIAALCSRLGRNYLVSEAVAEVGRANGHLMTDAGSFDVRGLQQPLRVFVPDTERLGPATDDGVSQGLMMAPTL
ncbi:MAG: adenylate/guanylate cyclase domain-containing protein [Pseudomonadota bacterium]